MCIAFFLIDAHPCASAVLTFNRDEVIDRPTKPLHFWNDAPNLLAGRDLVGGGTWFGITKQGRFGFLTNYREKSEHNYTHSRGDLVTQFLESDQDPLEYLQDLKRTTEHYAGFNLVIGDSATKRYGYYSNKLNGPPQSLPAGVYGISNGLLMQWPKVERGLQSFKGIMSRWKPNGAGRCLPKEELFELLQDTQLVQDHLLPVTGWLPEHEMKMSSIFVDKFEMQPSKLFGTRSQTVAVIWKDDHVTAVERYLEDEQWVEHTTEFPLEAEAPRATELIN